jgi:hypothetical protein
MKCPMIVSGSSSQLRTRSPRRHGHAKPWPWHPACSATLPAHLRPVKCQGESRRVHLARSDSIMKRIWFHSHAISHGKHTATLSGGRGALTGFSEHESRSVVQFWVPRSRLCVTVCWGWEGAEEVARNHLGIE